MPNEGLVVVGVVLLVLGVLLLLVPLVCFAGAALAIVGFVLLIVGAVQEPPRAAWTGYPPMYMPPGYAPQPGQWPTAPGTPFAAPPNVNPSCPRCGQPLEYVYEYQRWYCRAENVYPWG